MILPKNYYDFFSPSANDVYHILIINEKLCIENCPIMDPIMNSFTEMGIAHTMRL